MDFILSSCKVLYVSDYLCKESVEPRYRMSTESYCILVSDEEDTMEDDTYRNDCIVISEDDMYDMSDRSNSTISSETGVNTTENVLQHGARKTVMEKSSRNINWETRGAMEQLVQDGIKNGKMVNKGNVKTELLKLERRNHELRWRSGNKREIIQEKERRLVLQRRLLRKYNKHLEMVTEEVKKRDLETAEAKQRNVRERMEMENERVKILLEEEKVSEEWKEVTKEREIVTKIKNELEKEQRKNVLLKREMEEGKMKRMIQEQRMRIEHEEEVNIVNKKLDEAISVESEDKVKIELDKNNNLLRANIGEVENNNKQLREQLIQKLREHSIVNITSIVNNNLKLHIEKCKTRNKEEEEYFPCYGHDVENVETPNYSSKLRSGWKSKLKECDSVPEENPSSMSVLNCECFTQCLPCCSCRQGDILCGPGCSCNGSCTIGSLGSERLLEVKQSLIPGAGLGCFVTKEVPAGFLIQEYIGEILGSNISDKNPPQGPSYLVKLTNKLDIDGAKGGSEVIRTNHSNRPNCELCTKYVRAPGGVRRAVFVRSIRRLKCGQEVTLDYGPEYPTEDFQ